MAYASVYPLVSARAVARPFTYEVPDEVGKGAVVAVRFGRLAGARRRRRAGGCAPDGVKAAPVGRVLDELPPALVDLALWVAEYYGSTPARALELVAPVKRARRGERRVDAGGARGRGRARASSRPSRRRAVARIVEAVDARRRALPALRRDRERQDRGLPPGVRGRARAGARARSCSCRRSRSRRRRSAASRRGSASGSRCSTRDDRGGAPRRA